MTGHCFCGLVRYEATGAISNETSCHCTICRGTTGAPFVSWLTVPRDTFRFVAGAPTRFASSDHGTRSFCPRCGTQLTFESTQFPDEVDVTIGSLDHPERVAPRDHTFTRSRLPWVELGGLPAFPERRP
jgi:hypothetical protein